MDDLDLAMLADMLGRDVDERTLKTLELVVDDQGYLIPTNAGVLVACPHPERFFSFAYVQCARFRGPTKRDIWDQEEIYGPLPLAVDKVMRFLERNAFKHAELGDIYRKDVWSIPISPLREIVTNALVHASYSTNGTAIKVAFLDQTIEIESPGGLMPSLTVEDMVQGVSVIRNPAIARVFLEMGLIEKWGTGLPRAIQALTDAGLPTPEFQELPISLRAIVHIQNRDVTPKSSLPDDVVTDVARDGTAGLTDSERTILAILRSQGSVPALELASRTGLSDRQALRILVRLADKGLIKREGSTLDSFRQVGHLGSIVRGTSLVKCPGIQLRASARNRCHPVDWSSARKRSYLVKLRKWLIGGRYGKTGSD